MTEPSEPDAVRELSYDEALVFAAHLQRDRQFEPAEQIYRAMLELKPQDPNPMHFLGVLLARTGRPEAALDFIRRSLEIDPAVAAWHNNLGNVLLGSGRVEEAERSYAKSSELDPANPEVLNNLAVLQRRLGHAAEAEACLKRALEIEPEFNLARHNLAALYFHQKRHDLGLAQAAEAMSREPRNGSVRRMLSVIYSQLGRHAEAEAICREWLELEPDSVHARHYLAACTGKDVPERAPSDYVEQVFDSFAETFDLKLAALDYRAPELVGAAVAEVLGPPGQGLAVLDAGCGTGLCAPWLIPYAQRLAGVDLSQSMLNKAAERGQYHDLVRGELVDHLRQHEAAYDLVVSADTLCYFGALEAALSATASAMRPGGWLVFTVESHDGDPKTYSLHAHGRYSHHRAYVESCLVDAGLVDVDLAPVVLRHEFAVAVHGWLARARRAPR